MKKIMFIRNIFLLVLLLTSSNIAYSNEGYKDIKFDMTIREVSDLASSNNATFYLEDKWDGKNAEIQRLYKYDLEVWFFEGVVKSIDVIVFDEQYSERYFIIDSGIDKYEELRKNLSKKYKLVKEPDDLEIDKYNNNAKGDQISYAYLSDIDPKIVIFLKLKNYNHKRYIATVGYGHPQYTDAYLKKLGNSSDDF